MPRSRIIGVHIGRYFQSGPQDLFLFLMKILLLSREDAVDLPGRNINSPIGEHIANQWLSYRSLVVQGKNHSMNSLVEMPSLQSFDLFWKWGHDRCAIGSYPALTTVKDVP